MNVKRLFKGPWLWIILITVVVLVVINFSSGADGYKEVKTATMVKHFDDQDIHDVTFVEGDQEIRATLKGKDDEQIKSTWLGDQQSSDLVKLAQQQVDDGDMDSYNVEVPRSNPLLSLLGTMLPLLLFLLLFFWIMMSMQGGGGRVMQFGKSKA